MYDVTTRKTGKAAFDENYAGAAATAFAATDQFLDAIYDRAELTVIITPDAILPFLEALREDGYNFFETVTAVDWYPSEPRFQLSYHLLSHALKKRIRVETRLDSDNATINSITPSWPAANFYEREVFDLFGIHFAGHPNLTRIMMPDDWPGHPLRKDYPVEGYR